MVVIKSTLCKLLFIAGIVSGVATSTTTSKTTTISTTTRSSTTTSTTSSAAAPTASLSVNSTILIIAEDAPSALDASSGLNGYGIPFQVLLVPSTGVTLPVLNSSTTVGNYGGIVVNGAVSYDYSGTYASALTSAQWSQLYAYQVAFGVRMVQFNVYPGPLYGTTALGGCCGTGVEQLMSFSNTSGFTQAGLKSWAGVSTQGLYHYPASITDSTNSTWEVAQFAPNANFASNSTAAVINNFKGQQQMVFFISWATDWSPTSNILQHAWITWMTRGIYAGYRRTTFNTQVDDMFLETDLYIPAGNTFRVRPGDLQAHQSWTSRIQGKMNPGSSYFMEIGHNGNGNIEAADDINDSTCSGGGIEYPDQIDTPLEFEKPLGSGVNIWPATPKNYTWSAACTKLDALETWWANTTNRDTFGHISHTFTHEALDNATFSDTYKEIQFNQKWLAQVGIAAGNKFTGNGLIPPAITGLHNGDAMSAWEALGLIHGVGDNSRPPLRNQANTMWPYITQMGPDGYNGFTVLPRWPTRIYYNCDLVNCTVAEWVATSAGVNDWNVLIADEKADTMRYLFGLFHDAFMFHQANLRQIDVPPTVVNGVSSQFSLFQAWVETQVAEFTRLTNWPMVTLTQAQAYTQFTARMARDQCGYATTFTYASGKISAITLTAKGNTCSSPIPVTFPLNAKPTSTQGFATEQLGSDPLTVWVTMSGSPITFTLTTPIAL